MLRRNLASEFVAGAYVFPGGSVDPEDRGPEAEALCQGLTDAEASAVLGVDSGGLAFWVAALRECFEEAGVLVARPAGGRARTGRRPARYDRPGRGRPLRRLPGRGQPAAHRAPRRLRQEGLVLAADEVYYVEPLDHPRAGPPALRHPVLHHRGPARSDRQPRRRGDHRQHLDPPHRGLARQAAGEIELLPPTIANLRNIEDFRTTARSHRRGPPGHRRADGAADRPHPRTGRS